MKELHAGNMTLVATLRCNKRCQSCLFYAPEYTEPYHPTFERLCEIIDRFFEVITDCQQLHISGGEPLMRKDLPEVLEYIHRYRDQIQQYIRVTTNGSIPLNERLLSVSRDCGSKIMYIVDNYGEEISTHAESNAQLLTTYGISYELRDYYENPYFGGWVDFGDLRVKKRDLEEACKIFDKCKQKFDPRYENRYNASVWDGDMHICSHSRRCMEIGSVPWNEAEYVDLFDPNLSVEQIREKINGFYQWKSLTACQFCDGLRDDSVRIPAGQQLD